MLIVKVYSIALLLIAGNAIIWAQYAGQNFMQNVDNERDRRAIDFGLFVRNLLLKSATASNAKVNISRNVLNLKTATPAPTRRTTTTTTTTQAPFFFNKGPFRFPFDLSGAINNKFNGGYLNFDYDYGGPQPVRPGRRRRPTTTTTTTTTTAAPPATTPPPPPPPRRRPLPRRPFGFLGKQKLPPFDYYYDDYDYNYDDATNAPAATTAASPAPPSPPPPTPSAPAPAPNPPPPARTAKRPLAGNRGRAQGRVPQLRNRLVYQFRQPGDTSTNNAAQPPPPPPPPPTAAADEEPQQTPNTNSNNDESSANANDDVLDDDVAANAGATDDNNNISDDTNNNTEQDYNDSSDNINPNNNLNPNNGNGNIPANPSPPSGPPSNNPNFNFNANGPPFQGQFAFDGNPYPSGFGDFGASGGFQFAPYNGFNSQYQASSPTGYSVRYY